MKQNDRRCFFGTRADHAVLKPASFDLDKAQVQLLRQTGDLESWAMGPKR